MVMGKGLFLVFPGQQQAAIGELFIYLWDVIGLITKTRLDGIGGQTTMELNMFDYIYM